ncbi:hypothetical protein [Sphingobacterium cellulitidis]|uniref:hypothetical protein n=1 Tax=Sphingobacterium cellulitidis TaxID=1768011 RepID=UPI000B9444B1|nr:hypothetical protein CHT99_15635 [Sphingobacterium cellulitidis]
MGTENKIEKAGATTPATPSKVEETQVSKNQGSKVDDSIHAMIESLKGKVSEHEATIASKDAEIESLKDSIKKLETKSSRSKGKKENRFIVVNSFRSNVKAEKEKIYNIDEDVSDLDADRLENLVERGLVKKI